MLILLNGLPVPSNRNRLDKIIHKCYTESMLMNSKKFGLIIEGIVKEKKIPYLDAVVKYCDENEIDTATVGPLINKQLKEKIQREAEKLNLVEKSSTAVLPI
jgi:hypothetical protein